MPTGEKHLPVTVEAPPATQVSPGQSLSIRFSGGYVFANYHIGCNNGEDRTLGGGYAHRDRLAWSQYAQTTRFALADSEGGCEVEFAVPTREPYCAVVCAQGTVVGYVGQEMLPRSAYSRTVSVHLDAETPWTDEHPLTSVECGYECQVEFVIPPETLPGVHELVVLSDWLRERYEIEVTATGMATP